MPLTEDEKTQLIARLAGRTRNRAFIAATRKGFEAAMSKQPLEACPYPDWRTNNGRNSVTFSRAFRKYWRDGWQAGAQRAAEEVKSDATETE